MHSQGGTNTSKKSRKTLVITILVLLIIVGIGVGVIWWINGGKEQIAEGGLGEGGNQSEIIYSNFTGYEIADATLNNSPAFCVQIPNGSTDGARPQAGLTEAGVVFEAIAETGITRFAAIFQLQDTYTTLPDGQKQTMMTTPGIIGPIRSLRPYYLDWDTPFDCTVVHDGGSPEALVAIAQGGQRNLDENFNYMWKEANPNRLWNNVFTSPAKLLAFNQGKGYHTSSPKTFPRLTPEELGNQLTQTQCDDTSTEDCRTPYQATFIRTVFTNISDYIVNYTYDATSNTYRRSYERGGAHLSYRCPANTTDFAQCGDPVQVAPSAIAIMRVQESTMSDNYHEHIKTLDEGAAYIFQNGQAIEGTWQKTSQDDQIKFRNLDGTEIKFVPGQIWIAAIPQFGNISWE